MVKTDNNLSETAPEPIINAHSLIETYYSNSNITKTIYFYKIFIDKFKVIVQTVEVSDIPTCHL